MKSDVITIENNGNGFGEAVEATKKMADFNGLSNKDSVHLQLFTEEMLSMMNIVTGEVKASFWIECEGNTYELNLTTETVMDKTKRGTLIQASSSRKNEAAGSFLGMLRDAFEQAMTADADKTYYTLPDDVASDVVGHCVDDEEYDQYESSVLKKLADDVKIDIRGGLVHMTVKKSF
ncbi:MAG: hypothetical protein K6A69_03315 [Lachnospiraceae bacterium]|nr:hypothetical protein [Lachnospiraceae bacterium]